MLRIYVGLAGIVLCGSVGVFANAAPIVGRANWSGTIPPKKYLTEKEKADVMAGRIQNPNPPLNLDLDGDRMNDGWDISMSLFLPREFGQLPMQAAKTDENMPNPGSIFLVGIPDPAGLGFGSDHFSPRFVRKNDASRAGVEIGACVYTEGINAWHLEFEDANANKIPDKFLKSTWRSRNGATVGPKARERTYFVTDLTKEKVAAEKVVRQPGEPGMGTLSFSITDMAIVPLGVDPASVILGGGPIGLPGPSPGDDVTADIAQIFDDQIPLELNRLDDLDQPLIPGQNYTIHGMIQNTDEVSHEFALATFGLNATLLDSPAAMLIGPGQTLPYQLQFNVLGPGPVGISSLAYSQIGGEGDGRLDAVVMHAIPEPATWLLIVLSAPFIRSARKHRRTRQPSSRGTIWPSEANTH
jgi:hypothetical protein